MDYVRLSTNLYIHHVHLSRNLYVHYVRLSTSLFFCCLCCIDDVEAIWSNQYGTIVLGWVKMKENNLLCWGSLVAHCNRKELLLELIYHASCLCFATIVCCLLAELWFVNCPRLLHTFPCSFLFVLHLRFVLILFWVSKVDWHWAGRCWFRKRERGQGLGRP